MAHLVVAYPHETDERAKRHALYQNRYEDDGEGRDQHEIATGHGRGQCQRDCERDNAMHSGPAQDRGAAWTEWPRSAHASRTQWVFELSAHDGLLGIERVKQTTLDKPAESPRVVGRYALELYIGPELLDRVRFNVPLMGGEATVGNRNRLPKPRFDRVTANVSVRLADNPRAAYLLLVDRQTGDTQKLFWPPESDGTLLLWKSTLSEAGPGDFPDGGIRAVGMRDGGAPEAGPLDAGRD